MTDQILHDPVLAVLGLIFIGLILCMAIAALVITWRSDHRTTTSRRP